MRKLEMTKTTESTTEHPQLVVHQRLPTSASRGVMPLTIANTLYLAIPQHAADIAGKPAAMNGGDSDIGTVVYRWEEGRLP
jgi:hypothetical protein